MIFGSRTRQLIFASRAQHRLFASHSGIGDPYDWDHNTDWKKVFDLDSLLTDEEKMIRYVYI